jgi:hypothetical protein
MTRCASVVLGSLVALAAGACVDPGAATTSESGDVSGTAYMDLFDFGKIDQGAWADTIAKLNAEYSATTDAYVPLTFACSVTTKIGDVHDCAWTFASSQLAVAATTAAIDTNTPTYQCHIQAKTTAVKLVALLSSSADALHAPLPGAASIADQLAGCFDHPVGATPIASGATSPETYVAASAYYTAAASRAKWATAQAALLAGFNNICGDTFCSSDYSDLQSLDFECAVTKSTGNVKSCAWVFAGSVHDVNATTGAVGETSQGFRCTVAIKGTLPQLITTLTGAQPAGSPDPIDRALPGETTSAYDALGGCLP